MMKGFGIIISLFFLNIGAFAQMDTSFGLWMWTTGKHTFWDGQTVKTYGITNGVATARIPAPVLRVKQGDSVLVMARNQSQGPTHTIHLHGLDVDQANDGVPQTSFQIYHKDTGFYKFKAIHPGTYLYHCHVASVIHVQLGMYGNIIIEPAAKGELGHGYTYGRDFNVLFSEADKSWFDTIPKHSTRDSVWESFSIPKYVPDYFMVNGQSRQQIDTFKMRPDETTLWRFSNVGYGQNVVRFPINITATVVTSDGRVLPQAQVIDSLLVAPGERYGVHFTAIGEQKGFVEVEYRSLFTNELWDIEAIPFDWDATLSTEDELLDRNQLKIFPTLSQGQLTVEYSSNESDLAIELLDLSGRILDEYKLSLDMNQTQINLGGYRSGTYVIRVKSTGETKLFILSD